MTVTIRSATGEDAELISELVGELNEFHGDSVDHFTSRTVKQDLLGGDPALSLLLAELNGETVGYVLFHDTYDTEYGRRGIYICDLYVRPPAKRKGVATELVSAVAREADRRNRSCLWWASEPSNRQANDFYKALGAESVPIVFHGLTGEAFRKLVDKQGSRS